MFTLTALNMFKHQKKKKKICKYRNTFTWFEGLVCSLIYWKSQNLTKVFLEVEWPQLVDVWSDPYEPQQNIILHERTSYHLVET